MDGPVLLYDGTCGLCARSVQFVLRHDRRRSLRFASLDGEFARSVLSRHPQPRGVDTAVWYEPAKEGQAERVLTQSTAVLQILRYLGGGWRLGLVAVAVPRPLRDLLYALIARTRHALFGQAATCPLPPPLERHRFLD